MDYSYLVFATIWKTVFGNWPSYSNIFGMFLIAFSGILIAFREQIKSKKSTRKMIFNILINNHIGCLSLELKKDHLKVTLLNAT